MEKKNPQKVLEILKEEKFLSVQNLVVLQQINK